MIIPFFLFFSKCRNWQSSKQMSWPVCRFKAYKKKHILMHWKIKFWEKLIRAREDAFNNYWWTQPPACWPQKVSHGEANVSTLLLDIASMSGTTQWAMWIQTIWGISIFCSINNHSEIIKQISTQLMEYSFNDILDLNQNLWNIYWLGHNRDLST